MHIIEESYLQTFSHSLIRSGEKVRIYLSGKTGRQCTEKSHLCILFHGRTDGDHHVHVWCCRRMCPLRRMVSAADDLDDQHPKELYHGSSFPADRSRTAGSFHLPFCIPGRQGTGVTQHKIRESGVKRYHFPGFFIYASNAPKSMLVLDLGDCRDNSRNLQSVFLIVFSALLSTL